MKKGITRRDFLNAALIGMGAALLELPAPIHLFAQEEPWDGFGGTGDYSNSHGNTRNIVLDGHQIRDGRYDKPPDNAIDTGEMFDLVIIGGGLSGLGAAFYFKKMKSRGQKCLIIENHPIFGGEAKRNEFVVNGYKLIGPQGSNSFVVIDRPDAPGFDIYSELGIPKSFKYQMLNSDKNLHFDRTNFGFMLWYDSAPNIGYFFEDHGGKTGAKWVLDMWERKLEDAPFHAKAKKDFFTWRNSRQKYYSGRDVERWLDSMTYKYYLEKVMGVDQEITKFVDPILASVIGLGSDVISAFGAYQVAMPGFQGFPGGSQRKERSEESKWHSFPGGNDGFSRYFIKALIPYAIRGASNFEDVQNQSVNFAQMDRPENDISIRLGSLAVRVEHNTAPEKSEHVCITYTKGGKIYRLKTRSVVMASGSWVNQKIVRDLPADYKTSYETFFRSPILVINVAVTNWRFLAKIGITACRWFEGFGFSCNIRQPMIVGDYRPPFDPGKPAVVTFYVPFYYPGLPIKDQGMKGRAELLSTSYLTYESKIREQMATLFGKAGFDPDRDIAGIILNRWGHAYVNPQPGFYFGKGEKPAPRETIVKRFGRIAFAHSELNGHQHWIGAVSEGRRAVGQIIDIL